MLDMRFWRKVNFQGKINDDPELGQCHEYTGTRLPMGYGSIWLDGARYFTHRLVMGNPEGKVVRHRCDNPPCVKREHLAIGSFKDNMIDAALRGRFSRMSLTADQVREIRDSGEKTSVLAARYNVSEQTIRRARKAERYGWVE